jgi:hypothetical protein
MPAAQEGRDEYGIPKGGNNGGWTAKKWQNIDYKLTYDEIAAVVISAGWTGDDRATAVAVAAAESGRNPFIYNTLKKGHFGLFQISRSAWPDFFAPNGEGVAWMNPELNAKQGYKVFKQQGWGAWQAKTNGAYLAFLAPARAAVKKVEKLNGNFSSVIRKETVRKTMDAQLASHAGAQGLSDAVGGTITGGIEAGAEGTAQGIVDTAAATAAALSDIRGVFTGLWEALTTPAFWMRVAYGTTGVILVVGGLMLIVRNSPAAKNAMGAAQKAADVIPMGKAASAAKGMVKGKSA